MLTENGRSRTNLLKGQFVMGLWDDIGSKVDDIGEKVAKTGKEAVDKTKELAQIVKLKANLRNLDKKAKTAYAKIGKEYVRLNEGKDDVIMPEVFEEIANLKDEAAEIKKQIRELKGLVVCPECGKEFENSADFCSACGTELNK